MKCHYMEGYACTQVLCQPMKALQCVVLSDSFQYWSHACTFMPGELSMVFGVFAFAILVVMTANSMVPGGALSFREWRYVPTPHTHPFEHSFPQKFSQTSISMQCACALHAMLCTCVAPVVMNADLITSPTLWRMNPHWLGLCSAGWDTRRLCFLWYMSCSTAW